MNEKGIVVFGLAFILAAIIILLLLALIWLFWKNLFVFAIGAAVLYFAFTTVPQMVKGKQGVRYVGIAAAIGLLLILLSLFPIWSFSIYQPGAEAPFTGEIALGIKGRELTEGARVQVVPGETLTASFEGQWWNRSLSPYGNATAGANWYLDGAFVDMSQGTVQGVTKEYVKATNPEAGVIAKEQWQWTTLPQVAKLPPQGETAAVSIPLADIPITIDMPIGTHQVALHVFEISPAEQSTSLFECGTFQGACCPLQEPIPCQVFGATTNLWRPETAVCLGTPARCLTTNDLECRDYCCQKDWCGANWCSSYAPGDTTWISGWLYVYCDNGPRTQFGAWQEAPGEARTQEQAEAAVRGNDFVVALAEFEVVDECPTECCISEAGYKDKLCLTPEICTIGQCIEPTEPPVVCPYECCENVIGYVDKACQVGTCEGTTCIIVPPPPPPCEGIMCAWQALVDILAGALNWILTLIGLA